MGIGGLYGEMLGDAPVIVHDCVYATEHSELSEHASYYQMPQAGYYITWEVVDPKDGRIFDPRRIIEKRTDRILLGSCVGFCQPHGVYPLLNIRPWEIPPWRLDAFEEEWFGQHGYSRSAQDSVRSGVMAAHTALLRFEIAGRMLISTRTRDEMLRVLDLADHVAAWEAEVHEVTHRFKVSPPANRPRVLEAASLRL